MYVIVRDEMMILWAGMKYDVAGILVICSVNVATVLDAVSLLLRPCDSAKEAGHVIQPRSCLSAVL